MSSPAVNSNLITSAALKYIPAIRKNDSLNLRDRFDHFHTTLKEYAEFSFNTGSDGVPFNLKGTIFHPDTLNAILKGMDVSTFGIEINTDLLHVNQRLNGIFPDVLHSGPNDDQMSAVKG